MRPRFPLSVCATILTLLAATAHGQEGRGTRQPESFLNQQRLIEEELEAARRAQLPPSQRVSFEFGGWYSPYFFLFDDGINSSRTLRRHDLRLWARTVLEDGAHEFYLRIRGSFVDFNTGDSYNGNDDDWEGPNLERGYYQFDLSRALVATGHRPPAANLTLKLGRDLATLGTGLVLATPLDQVAAQIDYADFRLTGLAGRTVGSTQDFDLLRPIDRSRRAFFGAELRYRRFERHEPFVYVLWQDDRNIERRANPFQQYNYDSFYLGLGSTGELVRNLFYAAEWAYETGSSYSDGSFLQSNEIHAWALDTQLEYLFPGPHKTRASVEYLFGSGDSDRRFSPTSTIGGNRGDFSDTSFIGFGFRDTGLAFAPRYSNLHMWRAGASFYPWPDDLRLRELQLGADCYLFHKHHRDGAASDPTADVQSGYLGWELDWYANWRVTSDLVWTTRFGVYFPGSAFDDQTTRTFLLMGFSWSF